MEILKKVAQEYLKSEVTEFSVGDTVKVYVKIVEGDTERIQAFAGTVIARNGSGINETFTVRRVAFGDVEKRQAQLHQRGVGLLTGYCLQQSGRHGVLRLSPLHYREAEGCTCCYGAEAGHQNSPR